MIDDREGLPDDEVPVPAWEPEGEQHKGVDVAVSYGWATEAERDEAFLSTLQERADHTARELASTVRNFMRKDGE